MRQQRNSNRSVFGNLAVVATLLFTACATTVDVKPPYPTLKAGVPASILRIENQARDSRMAPGPFVRVTIDGFFPLEKTKLIGEQYLPKGTTDIHLTAGSHTLKHTGSTANQYYFNPVEMTFDTEDGKTYVIRIKKGGSLMKACYLLEYEGWPSEQVSQWPAEVCVANALFGR